MTLANRLTLARGGLGLLTFACLWTDRPAYLAAALLLYVAAIVTDWVDGWVARRTRSVSAFGAMADPVADKVLVIGTLIALLRIRDLDIPHWAVFLIVVRELVIGGLRALAGAHGRLLAAEPWGKWKMGVQSGCVLAILVLLALRDVARLDLPDWCGDVPRLLVLASLAVTWFSAVLYLRQHRRLIQSSWGPPQR